MNSVLKTIQTKVWLKIRIWKIRWAMEGNLLGLPLEDWRHSRYLWRYETRDYMEFVLYELIPFNWFHSPLGTFVRKLRGDTRNSPWS